MSETALKVENLSKLYQIGTQKSGSLRETLASRWQQLTGRKSATSEDFWALKDVSFEIKQGEAVGIIGRNGAGKSTLLKILSRITEPSKGRIEINGRVASLLEVGTGFHPELSGRENVYLNGTILGMTHREVKARFDEIVDFSGVEKFIDTPVKYYSSGMYVRLAFAVAAHLEPEILIIDEVLAVGDAEFQKKCLGKMGEVAGQGRTVLFVSHDMQAMSRLVTQCVLMQNGTVAEAGEKDFVINKYLESLAKNSNSLIYVDNAWADSPRVRSVELFTSYPNNFHLNAQRMKVRVKIHIPRKITKTCISFVVKDSRGIACLNFSYFDAEYKCSDVGEYTLECEFPSLRLFMGKYNFDIYFAEPPGGEFFQKIEEICPFEVVMYGKSRGDYEWQPFTAVYTDDYVWNIQPVRESASEAQPVSSAMLKKL